jgi:2-dehydropantoate 2-reductase
MPDKTAPLLLTRCATLFNAAGVPAKVTDDIRTAVWNKLFGNIALNPLSAITRLTIKQLLEDPDLAGLMTDMIAEAMILARAEGAQVETDASQRVKAMVALGAFRTSMLQDADAGRPLELDGILGAMIEVADRRGIAVPVSRRVYAMTRAFALNRRLMPLNSGSPS